MSTPVEVVFFLACVSVVALAAGFLVLLVQLRRCLTQWEKTMEDLKSDVKRFAQDSHRLAQQMIHLSQRVERQCDDVEHVLHRVRKWSDRANDLVEEIGSAIEPPLLATARTITQLRGGLGAFWKRLTHSNHHNRRKEVKTL